MTTGTLKSQAIAPSAAFANATLYSTVKANDHSGAGCYLLLKSATAFSSFVPQVLVPAYSLPPVSALTNGTLYGAVKVNDHSGAGFLRKAIYALDHSFGEFNPFRIAGIGTREWSFLDDTVLASFRVDGIGVRRWTPDADQVGEITITGTSTRSWAGTEIGDPEAFRINGTGVRSWSLPTGSFRITGTCTRRWTAAVGIADECLTADGESEGGGGGSTKNYVF